MWRGDGDGAAVGKLQMVFRKTAGQREARDVERILKTIQLIFFDRKHHRGVICQSDSRATPVGADGDEVHQESDESEKAGHSRGVAKTRLSPTWLTVASRK